MPDAVSGATGTGHPPPTSSMDRPDQMGKDVFLKLLVAQMRYQDPSNPVDSSQMMSQTAVFSQVEKLEQLATQNAALLVMQQFSTAGALVGQTVTYTGTTGEPVTGTVSTVRLAGEADDAIAVVDGVEVPVGRLTAVTRPAATS